MAEGAQPAIKNMALVKNKNNITEMTLAKRIREYKREHSLVLLSIDHDRLDMKDFLRQIRICESDNLPEARHWLGQKREKEHSGLGVIHDVVKLPPLSVNNTAGSRTERTAETEPDDDNNQDLTASGRFRTKRNKEIGQKLTLYNIYSRRAELVDAGPTWGTPAENKNDNTSESAERRDSQDVKQASDQETSKTVTSKQDDGNNTNSRAGEPTQQHSNEENTEGKGNVARTADVLTSKSADATLTELRREKGQRRRHRNTDGDFMRELLVSNANRRYRKKTRRPIQDRLVEFYTKLEQLKQREVEEVPTAKHIRRRYVLLTQGVKAALEISSDEEDDPH